MLGATVQNLVARATWRPEICAPMYTDVCSKRFEVTGHIGNSRRKARPKGQMVNSDTVERGLIYIYIYIYIYITWKTQAWMGG